jgi:hypothetical protein
MGGLPALDTFFKDARVPRSFLINWPLVRLAHLCMPCIDHTCRNCSENLLGSSIHCLLSEYANRTSFLSFRAKCCPFHVLCLDLSQTCPISHVMHRIATAACMEFCPASHLMKMAGSEQARHQGRQCCHINITQSSHRIAYFVIVSAASDRMPSK